WPAGHTATPKVDPYKTQTGHRASTDFKGTAVGYYSHCGNIIQRLPHPRLHPYRRLLVASHTVWHCDVHLLLSLRAGSDPPAVSGTRSRAPLQMLDHHANHLLLCEPVPHCT